MNPNANMGEQRIGAGRMLRESPSDRNSLALPFANSALLHAQQVPVHPATNSASRDDISDLLLLHDPGAHILEPLPDLSILLVIVNQQTGANEHVSLAAAPKPLLHDLLVGVRSRQHPVVEGVEGKREIALLLGDAGSAHNGQQGATDCAVVHAQIGKSLENCRDALLADVRVGKFKSLGVHEGPDGEVHSINKARVVARDGQTGSHSRSVMGISLLDDQIGVGNGKISQFGRGAEQSNAGVAAVEGFLEGKVAAAIGGTEEGNDRLGHVV